jgi:hypothetical protein
VKGVVEHESFDLWDRLERESPQAWEAFQTYRDMGANRSIRKVAEQLSKTRSLLERWSREHQWQKRTIAYDRDIDRRWQAERFVQVREMLERHAMIAKNFQAKVIQRLQTLNADDLTPTQVAQWLEVAVKIERLAYGATTENVGLTPETNAGADAPAGDMEGEELAAEVVELLRGVVQIEELAAQAGDN